MSRVNFTLSFDNTKDSEIEIIKAIKEYSNEYYMSQNAVIKMILRIAIVDVNILNFKPYSSNDFKSNINNQPLDIPPSLKSTECSALNNLVSNTITSLSSNNFKF